MHIHHHSTSRLLQASRLGSAGLALVLVLGSTACSSDGDPASAPSSRPEPAPVAPSTSGDVTASVPTGTVTSEQPLGTDRWIAYQTAGTKGDEIRLMRPDGSDDHRIAGDIADQQLLPDWSPDGTTLVFTTRGGDSEPLYEYDLATDTARKLFDCDDPCLGDDEPAYSPDGTQVAFIRASAPFVASSALSGAEVPSDCGIWIGDVASGEVRQVTTNTDPACDREYGVRWSPDGSKLAYWRDPYEAGQPTGTYVVVFDLESATETVLTDPADSFAEPDWSPDGEWLVVDSYPFFEFATAPNGSNLYRMHPDGTGLEQLTYFDPVQRAGQPRYTPDGRWILFTVQDDDRSSSRSTWIVPAEGGDPSPLNEAPGLRTHATLQS